jgi:hypothetical protein
MNTPPPNNPIRWAPQKRKHWANPQELKPRVWLVEEGSGPKATSRSLAVVRETPHGWIYFGTITIRYRMAKMEVPYQNLRSWRIEGPLDIIPELRAELLRIAMEFAP